MKPWTIAGGLAALLAAVLLTTFAFTGRSRSAPKTSTSSTPI